MARNLTSIQIVFYTHGDDKDGNTGVRSELKNSAGQLLASQYLPGNMGVAYPDGTTHTERMTVNGAVTTDDAASTTLHIHIEPVGNDKWVFDYHLEYVWGGLGQQSSETFANVILKEDHVDDTRPVNILPT